MPDVSSAAAATITTTLNFLEPIAGLTLPTPHSQATSLSISQSLIHLISSKSISLLHLDNSAASSSSSARAAASLTPFSFLRSLLLPPGSPIKSLHPIPDSPKLLLVSSDGHLFLADSLLTQPLRRLSAFKAVSAVSRRFRGRNEVSHDNLGDGSETPGVVFPATGLGEGTGGLLKRLGGGIMGNGVRVKSGEDVRLGLGYGNLEGGDGRAVFFAVVIGKRLVLAEFNAVSDSFSVVKEMQCVEDVQEVLWVDDSIFVGAASGYYLYSCVTGRSGMIFGLPEGSGMVYMKLMRREWRVMLMVDIVGVFVDLLGQPSGGSLVFRRGVDNVAEIGRFVVGVKDGKCDVYEKKTGKHVQTLVFGGEGMGKACIGVEEEKEEILLVGAGSKVFGYRKVPLEEQIKDLFRKKNFEGAISLVQELESEGEIDKDLVSFVHAQAGFLLLFDLHFEQAVDHFLQSETMHPSEVFPFIMRDPNRWSLLVPRNRYWGLHPPPAPLEEVIDNGLAAIQRAIFLKKAGVETAIDNNFLSNPPNRSDLLEAAIRSFIRYLEASRKKELTMPVKEGVDTLLMYLYRALNCVSEMEDLASSDNSCVVEELENLLDDSGHLRTLAFLYANKGRSSKALTIWRVLARNYTSLLRETGSRDDLQSRSDMLTGREVAATEASKILQTCSDQNLVLQHFGWISDVNQILAVNILTSERREKQLSPADVLTAIDLKKVEIRQRYLQWLIEDQDSDDTQFHTLYAVSLAKSALEIHGAEYSPGKLESGKQAEITASDHRTDSLFESPVRERLQIFLQSSDLYDPLQVLELVENSDLWLEKAILYRKLGQETLVLQILALKLEDSEAAEQYCAEIGRPDAYMQLLDMYLDPQDGKAPMYKAAVRLLHNHGESLDPLQVLETLSPEMPLQLASDTILRMFRARLHHHRQGQIVHNLSRAVDLDASLAILEERSRHVQINDESLCDSCHARLGTKLFAMYPDDTIVCYKCYRRLGESTSVLGRDFKADILIKPGWLVTQ
ncbi:hypothetical protein MLD38_019206 [Melastoma candidum]|uniref:Uncharacterized protein n=1 Tax=Melastoma candidum TaxID=119954 RepID=A0ACB9QZB9_9MYRT|nr:hypothetical protein MLD38_019206 [Melastoma candidum]